MKSIKYILTALVLTSSVVLSGCGGSESSSTESSNKAEQNTTSAVTTADTEVTTSAETTEAADTEVTVNDPLLGELTFKPLADVKRNRLDINGFAKNGKFLYYNENGKITSKLGIDVSSFNGDIDWEKVKNDGVEFAMIRIGGRGYGEQGTLYSDDNALKNIINAQIEGIKVGVYFYSQAVNEAEAEEEADYIKDLLGDLKPEYPVALDWEYVKDDDARANTDDSTLTTARAKAFCDKIKSYGYTPAIYGTSKELYNMYNLSELDGVQLWFSQYADTPNYYYEFSMWQYSEQGEVDGIDGTVDLNLCFTDIADFD